MHGTTLVTNTVIERTGATVGLITTQGFRDVIEVGREIRYDLYDLFLEAPPTLVPRHRRLEVGGAARRRGRGAAAARRGRPSPRPRASWSRSDGVEAIAISFMHAYRNPRHERRAAEIVRARLSRRCR